MAGQTNKLPINCAERNAVWIYPRPVAPRFPGAPTIIETTRSYGRPAFNLLPKETDVTVELYGGAVTLRLRGDLHRVYIERFTYVSFANDEEARAAFISLWNTIAQLISIAAVEQAAQAWLTEWSARQ